MASDRVIRARGKDATRSNVLPLPGIVLLVVILAACTVASPAGGAGTPGSAGPPASAPAAASVDDFPLPLGLTGSAPVDASPLDPAAIVAKFKLNSAAYVRLMTVQGAAGRGSLNFNEPTTVWAILETDRPIVILGPQSTEQPTPAAQYCWSFETLTGDPINGLCVAYLNAKEVPPLPATH
jgi:hypothetical protein